MLALGIAGCGSSDTGHDLVDDPREAPAPRTDGSVPSADVALDPLATWRLPQPGVCGDPPLATTDDNPEGEGPDWSEHAKVPLTGRANRYGFDTETFVANVRAGRRHAVQYPVTVTGSWLPRNLMERAFTDDESGDWLTRLMASGNPLSIYKDLTDFERWLGLSPFPDCDDGGTQSVPFPYVGVVPEFAMGSTRISDDETNKITYSCAGCHAERLFGRSILGLQNRRSRANVGAEQAQRALEGIPIDLLRLIYPMTEGEARTLTRLQEAMNYVGTKRPLTRGLDTSLAQVALSLAKRAQDPYATRDASNRTPRPDRLDSEPADSKPGNWWVLKYKNRWLLDGSVVAGNPTLNSLLWNEIGRGTDLHELDAWFDANQPKIDELTAAVFAAEPVRITEFFPAEWLDMNAAKRGKRLFEQACASCHGSYKKGWELPQAAWLPRVEQLATVEVRYHEETPVVDVGTDSLRNLAVESLVQLNGLEIQKKGGIVIKPQRGYVPPPLVGIWARYPYFHNNAAPSLCAVLTRASERPTTYYSGEQDDPVRDFDRVCNGYPSGDRVPEAWKADPEALYDTSLKGLSNAGHDEGVFLQDGRELFSADQKRDIIVFLQTL